MNPLVSSVGRLQRLAVFEAAARCGSFTAAAEELGMTQPAITRQIRELEKTLGRKLFDRSANKASLNDYGSSLLDAVQRGFATIEEAVSEAESGAKTFVLAANPGIAQRWLVSRLDEIETLLGASDLHLWLFDREAELADGRFDIAVHLGDGPWPGLRAYPLFPEVTFPVASPSYAANAGLGPDSDASDLIDAHLLNLDARDRAWMSWTDWFEANDVDGPIPGPTVDYSNYALVLQDVLGGRGVALGWGRLIDELIQQGLLTAVGPDVAWPGRHYNLLVPSHTDPVIVERFKAWFLEAIARGPVWSSGAMPTR